MDIRIENGDIVLNANGDYARIDDLDEAVQQVRAVVLTERGSFVYDRGFGVDYDAFDETHDAARLDMLIREATADIAGVETEVLSYDAERRIVRLKVYYLGRSAETEVNLSGIV